MLKTGLSSLFLFLLSINAYAHCPSSFKPEKVCLMLDQNVIFIYDEKLEHNGPYKDLTNSSIESVKSDGKEVKFARVSRGVYRIEDSKALKAIDVIVIKEKIKKTISVKAEQ